MNLLREKIEKLRVEKNAVILAHYYQEPDIQDIADYVGDSLGLSQQAVKTDAEIIVFAGVHFMAETAKILNPNKLVLLPDADAGCSLADDCSAIDLQALKDRNPNHVVISYINCSAEVKAISDIVCTSSNALKVVNSVPADTGIIFAPDRNLGRYIQQQSGRKMLIWDGACIVHEAFSKEKLEALHANNPKADIIAHPESEQHIIEMATFVGSTAGMIAYVKRDPSQSFIVATEAGILHKMQQEVPHKILIPAPAKEDNACACSECPYMKMNSLEKLYLCLLNETPRVEVSSDIRKKAIVPIERMLALSR